MNAAVEPIANAFNLASIALAGRNSIHTWWTGIVGCALFAELFFESRLYADVTLQAFFIGASVVGYARWRRAGRDPERSVTHTPAARWYAMIAAMLVAACLYAWALQHFTDAAAPLVDSLVLTFSVLGQLLLVARRVENWWCWLIVNSLATPLYAWRGLYLTAFLYFCFWINAWFALMHWRRLARTSAAAIGGAPR